MSKNGKGIRVSRSDNSRNIMISTPTLEGVDLTTLSEAFNSVPTLDAKEVDEIDRKIKMETGLDPHLGSGVYKMRSHSEIKEMIQASQTTVKERTLNGLKQVKKTEEELEKMAAERREKKLKMLEESKAAEKVVTPEQLELIRLRREIKRLRNNAETYKVVERKGPIQKDEARYVPELITLRPKVKRAFQEANVDVSIIDNFIKALDVLEKQQELCNNIEEPVIEIVKEEVILSKWGRIKLEARNWLRRQAGKLIILLQQI